MTLAKSLTHYRQNKDKANQAYHINKEEDWNNLLGERQKNSVVYVMKFAVVRLQKKALEWSWTMENSLIIFLFVIDLDIDNRESDHFLPYEIMRRSFLGLHTLKVIVQNALI